MERKPGKTATVSAEAVKALANAEQLTAEEENALRMVHGIAVDPNAPLARADGGAAELADELLMIEMALFRAHERSTRASAAAIPAPASADERAKSKIIRALRRKR